MKISTLKLGPLPDLTPVKRIVMLPPDIDLQVQAYVALHATVHALAKPESSEALIPLMLASFLASDGVFQLSRRHTSNIPPS